MPAYTISDGSTGYFPLAEFEAKYTGVELDVAEVVIAHDYALNTFVAIYSDASAQFYGYIREKEEIEQGALWKYTIYERAVELNKMPYLSGGLDIFSKTSITVANLATDIITSSPASGWTLAAGMADATSVSMNFYMVNRLQALNKVLREMRGYYVIFDSVAKTVKFLNATGINNDRSATNIAYITKTILSTSVLSDVTQVVVIGKDSSIRGTSGSSTSSRVYFQVDDIETNAECDAIAEQIWNDIGVSYNTYVITVDPTQIQYDVRDKVKVDGVMYWVREITQSMDEIELVIDTGKISVIDSLGSRIHRIEGNFPSGTDASWSAGPANISGDQSIVTTFEFDCKDATMIPYFMVTFNIGKWRASVEDSTLYLSEIDTVTTAIADSSEFTVATTDWLPGTSGLQLDTMANGWQHGFYSFEFNVLRSSIGLLYVYIELANNPSFTGLTTLRSMSYTLSASYERHVISGMFSGSTSSGTWYIRARIYSSVNHRLYGYALTLDRIPRHKHDITNDTREPAVAPTYIQYNINGGGWAAFSGTPSGLVTLITGKNTFSFRTNAAGERSSVWVTANYQTLGKS